MGLHYCRAAQPVWFVSSVLVCMITQISVPEQYTLSKYNYSAAFPFYSLNLNDFSYCGTEQLMLCSGSHLADHYQF